MKKEKTILSVPIAKESGIQSNPKNKFKTNKTSAPDNDIITSAVGKVKARSGNGLANEGTAVSYEEER